MDPVRKFQYSLLTLIGLISAGTVGYVLIEDWNTFEALYMTIITLATVGFREVHELSNDGKVFTIFLIIFGAGVLAYTFGSLIQFTIEGQLLKVLGRKKVIKKIKRIKGHYIVCGYGRIGQLICREFAAKPVPFVVVERDPALCLEMEMKNLLFIQGDATSDEVLLEAGIKQAKGLITAVTSDSSNVFITLTARGLSPDLFILARATEEGSELKLKRAGANKVVSPYTIGASRMAHAILRPSVVDFIEIATGGENLELQLEDICVRNESSLAGKTLINSGVRKDLGIIIVGINKGGEKMIFNPAPTTEIEAGDILITLGESPSIKNLEQIALGQA